jgi:hypothetical protein
MNARHVCIVLCVSLLPTTAGAEVKSLKIDPTGKLLVNEQITRVFGLRVACAAAKDEYAKQLCESLKAYKDAGVNTLLVCYQGGPGLSVRGFSPDGKTFADTAVRDRVRQICDAADAKDMLVVVSLFFPRRGGIGGEDPRLLTREAYLAACQTAAAELKDRKNVLICVADQSLTSAFASNAMKFTPADVVECLKAVAATAPNLPRGGGSSVHDANMTIAKSDAATVVFHAEPGNIPPRINVPKPIIHVGFVGIGGGRPPQGYYLPAARQAFAEQLDRYMDASTAHVIAHFPAWTDGGQEQNANRFDPGGQGTQADPGLGWYLDALSKRANRPVAATPEVPKNTGKSIFENDAK